MTPFKRHQVGGPEIIQCLGFVILVDMIYKFFGSEAPVHLTPCALTLFATGLFLLLWPMSMKAR